MEQNGGKKAELEAEKIRELAGGTPSNEAYELTNQNIEVGVGVDQSTQDEKIESQLKEIKRRLEESSDQVVTTLEQALPKTSTEFFLRLAPRGAKGEAYKLRDMGEDVFQRWFYGTENLSSGKRIWAGVKRFFKKETRGEHEIVDFIIENAITTKEADAHELINLLCKENNPGWLYLIQIQNKYGSWSYILKRRRRDGGDI